MSNIGGRSTDSDALRDVADKHLTKTLQKDQDDYAEEIGSINVHGIFRRHEANFPLSGESPASPFNYESEWNETLRRLKEVFEVSSDNFGNAARNLKRIADDDEDLENSISSEINKVLDFD